MAEDPVMLQEKDDQCIRLGGGLAETHKRRDSLIFVNFGDL